MESRLIVKNFGPIKFVDLILKNVNVFIGPQASGKSALAKIYTIVKAPRKFLRSTNGMDLKETGLGHSFHAILEEYNIASFLTKETEIEFSSELHKIEYKNGTVSYEPRLLNTIKKLEELHNDFNNNKGAIEEKLVELSGKFLIFNFKATRILIPDAEFVKKFNAGSLAGIENMDQTNCLEIITIIKKIEEHLSTNTSLYIPAERNFINIIKNSSLNLLLNNVPIPKHILSFGAELEKIDVKEISLDFIQNGLKYLNINGEDRIFTNNEHSIKLTEAASGIQSVIPVLIPTTKKSELSDNNHRSFVIEEPELNLFPLAQYELIKKLESGRSNSYWEDYGTIHTYTTHSPYILSAANNLLYASKLKTQIRLTTDLDSNFMLQADAIIPAEISPDIFTAYQINNGTAHSIFNQEIGLIEDNYIDSASDKINEDFEALMNLSNAIKPN